MVRPGILQDVAVALIGGGLYALALPPFDVGAAGWFVLVPLLLRVRGIDPGRGFLAGALLGATSAGTVTWYASAAAATFFGIGLVSAVLGLWTYYAVVCGTTFGLFGMGASVLFRHTPRAAMLTIPALWVGAELLRGRVLNQPWGLLGYTQHSVPEIIQVASLTGVYGVSFLIVLVSTGFADAVEAARHGAVRVLVWALATPAIVLLCTWISGAAALRHTTLAGGSTRPVVVVQTNVAPERTWTRAYAERQLGAHIRLTESLPRSTRPALIVWPENAVPRYLEQEPTLRAWLADIATGYEADLLFGAPRYENGRTYNAVHLIRASGDYGGAYDKQLLVPFAESTPLIGSPPSDRSDSPSTFSAGTGSGLLRGTMPIGVTICHEILYPEIVRRQVLAGAWLLVNVANDGWLDGGYGIASRQAFAMAVFRAVETRRYLVRAALTGVSGVVDPRGVVVDSLPAGTAAAAAMEAGMRSTLSPYVRYGDVFAMACTLIAALALQTGRARLRLGRLRPASAHPAM